MSESSTNSNDVAKVKSNEVAKVKSNEVAKINSNELAKANSNEVAKHKSNGVAKPSSNEMTVKSPSTSQRTTRSSAQGSDTSVQLFTKEDDLSTNEQRQNEINRINDGGVSDVFGQFNIDASEVPQIYKQLASLVHPDKQSDPEWRMKATLAQQSKSYTSV